MNQKTYLSAVVFGDLAGFSRLVNRDQSGTLAFMETCFTFIDEECTARGGDFVKKTGDGFLTLFDSASAAVEFSIAVHARVEAEQKGPVQDFRFRIGMHLGEIKRDRSDAYGHAINIAARLEGLAEPGSTLVSHDIYRQARHNVSCGFEARGVPVLKNIADQIATYRVLDDADGAASRFAADELRIAVLGGLTLTGPEGTIRPPKSGGVHWLLGCLSLSQNFSETKSRLAALLWPEEEPASATDALTKTLLETRACLARASAGGLIDEEETLELDNRTVSVDLASMLNNLKRGEIEDVLLEGFDWEHGILPSFNSGNELLRAWLAVTRKRWRQSFTGALERVLTGFEASEPGAWRASVALLALEPGHEPASQMLISHHIAAGNRVAAMGEFRRLSDYLTEKFGFEPSAEIETLIEDMSAGGRAARPKKPGTPPGGVSRLQITVGRIGDGDGPAAHRVFGFRAELIANLARFREWTVFDISSPPAGEGPERARLSQAGRYTLSGSANETAVSTDIALRLVDEDSGRVVWSETVQLNVADWQKTQRKIVGRIAATLEIYLSADRLAASIADDGGGAVSFDRWLRGELLLSRWTPEGEAEATRILESVIDDDPGFAPAHASLASIHNVSHVIHPGKPRGSESNRQALKLGRTAVELDPMDARNHLAVAWTAALAGYFDHALVHLDLAVQLNPNSPKTVVSAAMGYAFFGDPRRSVELLNDTLAIAPIIPDYLWSYIAACLFLAGDYEGSLSAATRAGDAIVDNQGWRAIALSRLGRRDEAASAFETLVENVGKVWLGDQPPTRVQIRDWFATIYPIRREEDRAAIADGLMAVCAGGS